KLNNTKKITVLCAEDEVLIALDLESVINDQSDMICLGLVTDITVLIGEMQKLKPDFLILDLHMSGENTSSHISELIRVSTKTNIIIFSGSADQIEIDSIIKNGAKRFVIKDGNVDGVILAIRELAG
ncbi:MAG: response regulator, partial [bacterium]|nr:response regulator [bacterium]